MFIPLFPPYPAHYLSESGCYETPSRSYLLYLIWLTVF
ncbi:Uncharacterized protein dnm_009250 [Desulfonema magnum]|uniref:Uncharacterized protein n=1 Tax=Desulfonema magnum TaxID=45655 RepID=A0A975BG70_9BACT|nr:Uncharacterized protein dnm_009250 [Desulfonema magnum]